MRIVCMEWKGVGHNFFWEKVLECRFWCKFSCLIPQKTSYFMVFLKFGRYLEIDKFSPSIVKKEKNLWNHKQPLKSSPTIKHIIHYCP